MKFFFWLLECWILPLGIFIGKKNQKKKKKNREKIEKKTDHLIIPKLNDRKSMIEIPCSKKTRSFSNRLIENDRSLIFDRNHYVMYFRKPWLKVKSVSFDFTVKLSSTDYNKSNKPNLKDVAHIDTNLSNNDMFNFFRFSLYDTF